MQFIYDCETIYECAPLQGGMPCISLQLQMSQPQPSSFTDSSRFTSVGFHLWLKQTQAAKTIQFSPAISAVGASLAKHLYVRCLTKKSIQQVANSRRGRCPSPGTLRAVCLLNKMSSQKKIHVRFLGGREGETAKARKEAKKLRATTQQFVCRPR